MRKTFLFASLTMFTSIALCEVVPLTPPAGIQYEFLSEVPVIPNQNSEPNTEDRIGDPVTSPQINQQIEPGPRVANPADKQPSPPRLPDIGYYLDMPGTTLLEFTRITPAATDQSRLHHYARRSAIDPFHKYIILTDYLYHLADLTEFKQVPLKYEYVASQTQEDVFYGFYGSSSFAKWNAATDEITEIYTAPSGMSGYSIGVYEGEMSWDDRIIALNWNTGGGVQTTILDTTNGNVLGSIHSSHVDSEDQLNWVDVSPTGKYVLIGMNRTVYRFNADLTGKVALNTQSGGSAHGDLMYDAAGNEVFVQEGNFYQGQIAYTILSNNTHHTMDLVDTTSQENVAYPNSASHISGQARDLPGFVFVSLQDTSGMFNMFGAYLKPNQSEVYRYGYTFTNGTSYGNEAKASIDNTGRYIVWTSDWMGGTTYEFLAKVKCISPTTAESCTMAPVIAGAETDLP